MRIRKASQKDLDALVQLWKQFMQEHEIMSLKANPNLKEHIKRKPNSENLVRRFFSSNIRSKQGLILLAQADKKPIGYCLAYVKANIPIYSTQKLGYISDIFVKKEYRRQGVATKLKNYAQAWFKKIGLDFMSIAYYTVNKTARKTYTSWGFTNLHAEMRTKIR